MNYTARIGLVNGNILSTTPEYIHRYILENNIRKVTDIISWLERDHQDDIKKTVAAYYRNDFDKSKLLSNIERVLSNTFDEESVRTLKNAMKSIYLSVDTIDYQWAVWYENQLATDIEMLYRIQSDLIKDKKTTLVFRSSFEKVSRFTGHDYPVEETLDEYPRHLPRLFEQLKLSIEHELSSRLIALTNDNRCSVYVEYMGDRPDMDGFDLVFAVFGDIDTTKLVNPLIVGNRLEVEADDMTIDDIIDYLK